MHRPLAHVSRLSSLSLAVTAVLMLAGGSSCRTIAGLSPGVLSKLKESPDSYLSGEVAELKDPVILNSQDFVYSIAASRDAERVAFTHLGPKTYQVSIWKLGPPPSLVADPSINHYQYDVEALDFSPDGKVVVTVSRDGGVRFYSALNGLALGAYATEEPLVSVAFHPSGKYVVAGSAKGLLTVLSFPSMQFSFEQRVHEGEVRNLAFARNGTLFSGGWDKSIIAFDAVEEQLPTDSARLRFERRGGFSVVRATVDDRLAATFAFDSRTPYVVVNSEVAKVAGIDVAFLKDTVNVATAMGSTVARVAKGRTLTFKALKVKDVDVAVCDACVPPDTQGVLGEAFSQRYDVAFDEITSEAVITSKVKAAVDAEARFSLVLKPRKRMTFEWFVNDFSVDRTGQKLGVAFSEIKAERTREIYEREKKGIPEPIRPGNAGAIVDAQTGLVLQKWSRHEGVVCTAAISPDGQTLATGGWDKKVRLNHPNQPEPLVREFGWSVRRVRFSEDGRLLLVAAWTPQNPLGDQQSKPSAVAYELSYRAPDVVPAPVLAPAPAPAAPVQPPAP